MQKPPCLMKETEPNLDKPMGELCQDKDELTGRQESHSKWVE